MENKASVQQIKKKQNRYKLVIINEDSFEEVTQFRLTRWAVYFGISTVFISMVFLTVGLIVFTPIKYYLPGAGFGNVQQMRKIKSLSLKSDSLEKKLFLLDQRNNQIIQVLKGEIINTDTALLSQPEVFVAANDTLPKTIKQKNGRKQKRKKR